jgi:di/tricarboxylate transporter
VLRNTFRKVVGVVILLVFGLAVVRFAQQTAGNPHVGGAVASGFKFILFLALVLGLVYLADRRLKRQP